MPTHFMRRIKRLFSRSRDIDVETPTSAAPEPERPRKKEAPRAARPTRREADIPLDVLDRTYTPPLTSSKASFRSDGSDHQRDQELTPATADERFNDEDRYTNKSGDPRIGTHRRTYEPGEARGESHD
jgi:hypothetical protein